MNCLGFTDEGTPIEDCDSEGTLNYESDIQPLIDQYGCQGCHMPAGIASFYLLTSYDEALEGGRDSTPNVIARNPQDSLFYQVVGPDSSSVSRMPLNCEGDRCLSEEEYTTVFCWIKQGAVENPM